MDDGALNTASACGESVCGGAAMTADETGFSMVMTFTKGSHNTIVGSGRSGPVIRSSGFISNFMQTQVGLTNRTERDLRPWLEKDNCMKGVTFSNWTVSQLQEFSLKSLTQRCLFFLKKFTPVSTNAWAENEVLVSFSPFHFALHERKLCFHWHAKLSDSDEEVSFNNYPSRDALMYKNSINAAYLFCWGRMYLQSREK